jgi:hypothetical protein
MLSRLLGSILPSTSFNFTALRLLGWLWSPRRADRRRLSRPTLQPRTACHQDPRHHADGCAAERGGGGQAGDDDGQGEAPLLSRNQAGGRPVAAGANIDAPRPGRTRAPMAMAKLGASAAPRFAITNTAKPESGRKILALTETHPPKALPAHLGFLHQLAVSP